MRERELILNQRDRPSVGECRAGGVQRARRFDRARPVKPGK